MIVKLMAYTAAISLLTGLAALAIEHAVALAARPRRWIWAAAMVISLAGPATLVSNAHWHSPASASAPISSPSAAVRPLAKGRDAPVTAVVPAARPRQMQVVESVRVPAWLETSAQWAWLGSSLCLVGLYVLGAVRLRHLRRNWRTQAVGEYQVFITGDIGPAVFGLLRPSIVLPRWLLTGQRPVRDIALAHESEHVAAHDPALVLAGLLLLAVTPWNPPLWWQLRRLRLAVEIDCDRRVLATGTDMRNYVNALLQVNQQAARLPFGSIAIVGRASQVERRIRAMLTERPRNKRLWITVWAAASIPLLVAAAELSPPASTPGAAPAHQLEVGIADFDINGAATSAALEHHPGALVTAVVPGGPADLAGVQRGDVILRYGDTGIPGFKALVAAVSATPAGEQHIPLLIRRDGREIHLTIGFSAAQVVQPPSGKAVFVDASEWDNLRDASVPVQEPEIRQELIRISGLDELQKLMADRFKQQPPPPNTTVITANPPTMNPGAEPNVRRLQDIIAQHGWPTISMVGVGGAHAAAMIALSARDDFKATALTLMEPLVHQGEIPTAEYAVLYDAVHTLQRYGTQVRCDNGEMKPSKPIEDPDHLDARRAALGLPDRPQFCVVDDRSKTGG